MKTNVFRMLRSGVAMLLALCMVVGMCPVQAFAAEVGDKNDDGVINYVSFGASNVNGYGLTGYLPEGTTAQNKADANVYGYQRLPVGSYPYLVAAALNEKLGGTVKNDYKGATTEEPFSKVHVDQLAMSSMRAEELRFLLDETYHGDNYTDWRFYDVNGDGDSAEGNWFGKANVNLDTLRGFYADAIRNADLITYDMGINNFGVFMNRAMTGSVSTDLNDIDPEIAAQYAEAKEYVRSVVAENSNDLAAMMNSMDAMIDALAFTLVGFCTSFDATMEKIYDLNPDANVVVVSIQCLLTGLDLQMDGMEGTLPLGEIFGEVINAANMYTAEFSPYSDKYYYADVSENGRVEFFVDQLLAYNGDPATLDQDMIDCYMVYDDDLNRNNQIIALVNGYLAGLVQAGLDEAVNYMPTIYGVSDEAALLMAYLADGANGFTQAEQVANAYADHLGGADAVAALLAIMKDTYTKYCVAEVALYNVIYDVLTEIMQAAVEDHTLNFSALQFEGKGRIEDDLLAAIVTTVMAAADKTVIDPSYQFDMDEVYPNGFFETLAAQASLDASLVKTIACMGVRTGIGNSFYGHPTRNGHKEIANTVLAAMEKEISGEPSFDRETQEKLEAFYNFLKEDNRMNTEEKVDLLEKLYSIVKGKISLDDNPEVAAVEKIYAFLVENEHITDEQTLDIVLHVYECLLDDRSLSDEELLESVDFIYNTLLHNETLTDAQRLDIVVGIFEVLEANGYLDAFAKELKVLKEIVALPELEYVTAKQTFAIVEQVYNAIKDGSVNDAEARDIIANIYITVFKSGEIMPISEGEQEKILTATEKLAVIEAVYGVLEANGYLNADEIPALKAALDVYKNLRSSGLLSDEDIFDIIDRTFTELFTAEEINEETLKTLVTEIVEDVLTDTEIPANDKVDIALVVYNALVSNGIITTEQAYDAAYKAVAALYELLRDKLIEMGPDGIYEEALNRGYIDALNSALNDLLKVVESELNTYVNGAVPAIKKALADLQTEAKTLEAQLASLKQELETKVTELENQMAAASGEANADILASIAATKAAIAQIEKAIAETEAALLAVNEDIEACLATLKDLEDAIRYLDNRVVDLIAQVKELNAILENGETQTIESVTAAVEASRKAIESTINLIQTTFESADELVDTISEVSVKAVSALQNAAENAVAILENLSENMADYTEEFLGEEAAKLQAEIDALKAEFEAQAAPLKEYEDLILAAAALAAQVVYDRESQPDGAITLLNAKIEQAKQDLLTATGDAKAELEKNLPIWEQELKDLEAKVEKEAQEAYDKALTEAEKQYNITLVQIEEQRKALEAELTAKTAELNAKIAEITEKAAAAYEQIKPYVEQALPVIKTALENAEDVLAAVKAAIPEISAAIEKAINDAIAAWNKAYNNATTQAHLLNADSYYVALGDSSAVAGKSYNSYVDELAAELELSKDEYVNYATEMNNALEQLKALSTDTKLQADIAKADLVTIGFSNVTFMSETVNTLVTQFMGGKPAAPDWAAFVPEEDIRYVDAIRDEIYEGLTVYLEEPMDPQTAAMVTAAIEAYAYGVVAYAVTLPELVNAIHAINPDASVVVVGMYNPMKDVVIDMTVKNLGISQQLELSDYIDMLVEAAEVHGIAYSMITGNSIYVDAPDVQTVNTSDTLGLVELMAMFGNNCAILNPNAEGHEYIQTCIYEALDLYTPEVYRVYGRSRYFTALEIADTMLGISGADKFDNIVVAYGANFPDALAGTYLATQKNAPILLIDEPYVKMVCEYIAENMAADGTIYILGDQKVVSKDAEAALAAVGKTERVASGSRYRTNLEILKKTNATTGELLVVTATAPWDSLSASGSGCPILLVGDTLRDDQKEYLSGTNFSRITIIGDGAAVPETMEAELAAFCGDINRVGAKGRYNTSVAVAEYFFGNHNKNVVLAFGQKFPDGLCGGPLAAMIGAPVVLAEDARDVIDNYVKQAYVGVVLGSEGDGGSQITDAEVVDIFELFSAADIVANPYAK